MDRDQLGARRVAVVLMLAIWLVCALASAHGQTQPPAGAPSHDPAREPTPAATLFGLAVAGLGDCDRDGEQELAIGAPAAWTAAGRTGAVLIVRARDGRLLRTIPGPQHGAFFGAQLRVEHSAPDIGPRLLVDARTWFDPRTGGQLTPDGKAEAEPSIGLDYDGDGVLDALREVGAADTHLVLVSGISRAPLSRVPLCRLELDSIRGEDPRRRVATLALDADGDGRRDLAVAWPNFSAGTSKLFLFCGAALDRRRGIWLGSTPEPLLQPEMLWRDLYTCGDLNGDGCEDVLAARTQWPDATLTCYSGADGVILWTAADVLDSETTAVDRMGDLDGDGVPEVLSGRVQYKPGCGVLGLDGTLIVLSGRSGRRLVSFDECDYPGISLGNYLELRTKFGAHNCLELQGK